MTISAFTGANVMKSTEYANTYILFCQKNMGNTIFLLPLRLI